MHTTSLPLTNRIISHRIYSPALLLSHAVRTLTLYISALYLYSPDNWISRQKEEKNIDTHRHARQTIKISNESSTSGIAYRTLSFNSVYLVVASRTRDKMRIRLALGVMKNRASNRIRVRRRPFKTHWKACPELPAILLPPRLRVVQKKKE